MPKLENKELKNTSVVLGDSAEPVIYESNEPDVVALLADTSLTYENIAVRKTGSSEREDTINTGNNGAVKITGSGIDIIINNSTISSEGSNSDGFMVNDFSTLNVTESTVTTFGSNNPAFINMGSADISVENCTVNCTGTNSPVLYCNFHPGIANIKSSDISTSSEYLIEASYSDYDININQTRGAARKLCLLESSGYLNISESNFDLSNGIIAITPDSTEDITDVIIYLKNNEFTVDNELVDFKNVDYYISLSNNTLPEFDTFAKIEGTSAGTLILKNQELEGDIEIDSTATMKLNIVSSEFTGTIKVSGNEYTGNRFRVNLSSSTWNLTEDTTITELTLDENSNINLNGHILTVGELTSEYKLGYVVNYRSSDGEIEQNNLVIIKVNSDNTYNLYDTDDYITYNDVSEDEMIFTARVVDDIEAILAEIDQKAKDSHSSSEIEDGSTVIVGRADVNGILIDNEIKEHTDITVIKSGSTTVDEPSYYNTKYNAGVLVTNTGEFTYHFSSVSTNGNYSTGLMVENANSLLTVNDIELRTEGNNSPAIIAIDNATFEGNKLTVETLGQESPGLYVDNAEIDFVNSNLTSSGIGAFIFNQSGNNVISESTIEAEKEAIKLHSYSELTISKSNLNSGIEIDNSTLYISQSNIVSSEYSAYTVYGTSTINNGSNDIRVNNNTAIYIAESNCTMTLTEDVIRNTGEFPSIVVTEGSTVDLTIDNTKFYTEDLMLEITGNSTVNLTVSGNQTIGDIFVEEGSTLNFIINGDFKGTVNGNGIEGAVNVTITENGTWGLTYSKDSYIDEITIEDHDNTRVKLEGTSRLFVGDESFYNKNDSMIDDDTGYTTKMYPTQRILRVCNTQELPDINDRDPDYMYFVYDKMEMYVYQSRYSDPFCIINRLPATKNLMTDRMLYITLDGYIYSYMNYKAYQLGTVENFDPAQIEILANIGTVTYLNAESRYIDKQKRTIQLPFKNGNYQLNLSIFEDVAIDEDTTIRFNPDTEQFYIAGKEYQFENKLNNIYSYSGRVSNTVKNIIDGHTFRSKVKISEERDNSIEARNDGLYISKSELATWTDYDRMILTFSNFKTKVTGYVDELKAAVAEASDNVSADAIAEKITEALEEYSPTIESMFNNYATLSNRLTEIETTLTTTLNSALESAKDDIKEYINQTNQAWSTLPEPAPDPEQDNVLTGLMYSNIRSVFSTLRESDDGSDPIHSEGIIPDVDYTYSGLTEDETSVQVYIFNQLESIQNMMSYYVTVESYAELPEYGDWGATYFVIKYDEENPVYQIYNWTGESYELIYDLYA